VLAVVADARAGEVTARIADVAHLKGQRVNRLIGMGLVTGLNGSGDGDDYAPTVRALAEGMKKLAAPVASMDELKDTKNVAMVFIEAVLPENGVREGDRVDVQITSFGAAKSLAGGRLLPTPLVHHDTTIKTVFAFASGPVVLPNPEHATAGIVRDGAVLEEDVLLGYLAFGRELPYTNDWIQPDATYVTLVLDDAHAGWTLAHEVAVTIDSELSLTADVDHVALAVDPKNIIVLVPQEQIVSAWVRDIESLQLLVPDAEARVTINRHSGTIVVSGDAKMSPIIVSQKGLTVSIVPPGPDEPQGGVYAGPQSFVSVDPGRAGGTNVTELLEALNRLAVPVEDRIAILTEIHRLGKLHAKLLFEGE
jgi:flagellar P-ring protein precursor FlgI